MQKPTSKKPSSSPAASGESADPLDSGAEIDSRLLREFVLQELGRGPLTFYLLCSRVGKHFSGHTAREVRDGLNRVLKDLISEDSIRYNDPLPKHYRLIPVSASAGAVPAETDGALPPLTKDQRLLLIILLKEKHHDRNSLALDLDRALDPNDATPSGVNEDRITDAMNGSDGLKAKELATHQRKHGYRLTPAGRAVAQAILRDSESGVSSA